MDEDTPNRPRIAHGRFAASRGAAPPQSHRGRRGFASRTRAHREADA